MICLFARASCSSSPLAHLERTLCGFSYELEIYELCHTVDDWYFAVMVLSAATKASDTAVMALCRARIAGRLTLVCEELGIYGQSFLSFFV